MATIDELKKKDGSAVNAGAIKRPTSFGDAAATSRDARVNRIPVGGTSAPAPDGQSMGNDFTRNMNTSLNALGGMGVMASVPLKTAAAVQSGYGALQSSVKAAPVLANGVPGANFIAGANGVRQVGGANLPAVINAGAPVAKSVNVALQEGAKANQLAAGTQSFGNASAALGVMDGQQVPPVQVAQAQPALPTSNPGQIPTTGYPVAPAAGAIQAASPMAPQAQPVMQGEQPEPAKYGEKWTALGEALMYSSDREAMKARAAGALPVNQSDAESQRLARTGTTGITGTAPQAVAPQAAAPQAAPKVQSTSVDQPRDEFSNAATLERNPGGAVRKIVDANGKTTGYSGGNVTGDIALTGINGGALPGRARGGLSSMDTSAGYASDLRQLAEIEKNKAAQEVSMQGQADYAAMRAGRMSKKDYQALQAGNKADATTRRGQDIQAGATRDSSRLAQERLKLDAGKAGQDATNANLDNESKTMLLSAQKAFLSAKTPEEQQSALAVLTGLSGKAQPAPVRAFAVPGGQATDANGTPYTMASSVYDPDTKQFIQQNGQQGGGQKAAPPSTAVQMLKDNPTMAAQFDAKYGPGASKQYLAQK